LWLAAGGFMLVGLVLVLNVRPDPRRIAELLDTGQHDPGVPAAPLRELLRRPGIIPALLAAQASFAVMVGVMTLTGAVVVDPPHHAAQHDVPSMYALVIVVGDVIDRIGRTPSLSGGLALMAVSVISLLWIDSVLATGIALFGLGLGWNLSFVAATAQLADGTRPHERGKLLGFNDLLSGGTGAALALLGGVALSALGVAALAIGGALLVAGPAIWILREGRVAATTP
jgi:predicted MFS family arabinose efflux permease